MTITRLDCSVIRLFPLLTDQFFLIVQAEANSKSTGCLRLSEQAGKNRGIIALESASRNILSETDRKTQERKRPAWIRMTSGIGMTISHC